MRGMIVELGHFALILAAVVPELFLACAGMILLMLGVFRGNSAPVGAARSAAGAQFGAVASASSSSTSPLSVASRSESASARMQIL